MGIEEKLKKIKKAKSIKFKINTENREKLAGLLDLKRIKIVGIVEYRRAYEATTSQDRKVQTERIIKLKQMQ